MDATPFIHQTSPLGLPASEKVCLFMIPGQQMLRLAGIARLQSE